MLNPYTSQRCPKCGTIDKRSQSFFKCIRYGYQGDADYITSS
ncbi:MAG TPA: transposase [Methanothermobacter sp.]|nr:transposase [Methanothermobacter sp.]